MGNPNHDERGRFSSGGQGPFKVGGDLDIRKVVKPGHEAAAAAENAAFSAKATQAARDAFDAVTKGAASNRPVVEAHDVQSVGTHESNKTFNENTPDNHTNKPTVGQMVAAKII
jgi:hypothetical protein